jgi:hypothetical protein
MFFNTNRHYIEKKALIIISIITGASISIITIEIL